MDAEWFYRLDCERRVGNVPHGQALALKALGTLLLVGDLQPSEARVASEAGVSLRTVQRAKVTGRGLRLLDWSRQFGERDGLRQERPCSYRAEMPAAAVLRRERHLGARMKEAKQQQLQRSIEQQLAGMEPATPEQLARRAEYKARVRAGLVPTVPGSYSEACARDAEKWGREAAERGTGPAAGRQRAAFWG